MLLPRSIMGWSGVHIPLKHIESPSASHFLNQKGHWLELIPPFAVTKTPPFELEARHID